VFAELLSKSIEPTLLEDIMLTIDPAFTTDEVVIWLHLCKCVFPSKTLLCKAIRQSIGNILLENCDNYEHYLRYLTHALKWMGKQDDLEEAIIENFLQAMSDHPKLSIATHFTAL